MWIGDLMFILGLSIAIKGLKQFKRVARLLLPLAGYLPIRMLFPPGAHDESPQPNYERYWELVDLIAGDKYYIRKYSN